jgi:hypothetical protein
MKELILAGITILFTYALFVEDYPEAEPSGIVSNLLSCQTCRKQKEHIVVGPGIYQCPTCKRTTYLRH